MSNNLNMSININAIDMASNVFRSVGSAFKSLASGDIVGAATVATTAIAAVGGTAVKMAGDFQQGVTTLSTGAGEAQSKLKKVGDGMLDLAVKTGTSTQQLSAGMFMIESAGFRGADGLNVLKTAAEGAKVGNADLGVVANALTTMMTDYHLKADQSASAMNGLTATVSNGKTVLQLLGNSMGSVLPIASKLHVSFPEVAGAMATMTNAGVSAQQSAQNISKVLTSLAAPSSTAVKSMKAVGLSAQEVSDTLSKQGLSAALQEIEDHVGKKFPAGSVEATTALKNIMGGITGLKLDTQTGGASMAIYKSNIDAISSAMKNGGDAVTGFDQVQGDFNFKMAQAQQAVNVLMIKFGSTLLPVLGKAVDIFTALISGSSLGGFGPIMRNVSGMLGIFAANWQDLADSSKPFMASLHQFGTLLGQLLPGFVSQALGALDMLQLAFMALAQGVETIAGPWLQYIGQVLNGILSATGPVLNAIEGKFIPALQNIVGAIAPIIAGYFQWIVASGIIPVVFSLIGNAVGIVITVFSFLINVIANVINFFRQHQAATYALIGVLALIGITILALVIPPMITMVATMIAGAIAATINFLILAGAVLLVAAPFILIGILIGLVIFGIVKAVQNWGAIWKWLQDVTSAALNALGAFFVGVWNHIVDGLKAAWNFIVQVVRIGVLVLLAIIFAPIILIAALFIWLYQHNTYFKKLVDAIVGFVQFGISWLRQAWQDVVNWLAALWQSIVGIATNVWNTITSAIHTAFNAVLAVVTSVWQTISGIFVSAWSTYISGPLTTLWRNVSSVFSNAWNTYIAKPLNDIWNFVSKWFTDLGTSAMNSGKNFITMLVSGITSGAGAIWNAVVNLAKNIWKALGFHSPAEEGPGADADKWMPNLVSMLSTGLVAGVPKIQAAVNLVAKPLAVIGHPAQAGVSSPVAASAASSSAQGGNNFYITINAPAMSRQDGKKLVDQIEDEISRRLRRSGNHVTWTSGGSQ